MKIKNKFPLSEYFGDTPQLRVLDFLIDNHFFDFPITIIAKESNVSYNSIKLFFPIFVKSGILVKTRKIGKSDYYQLNIKNPFVKNLIKLDWSAVKSRILMEEKPIIA